MSTQLFLKLKDVQHNTGYSLVHSSVRIWFRDACSDVEHTVVSSDRIRLWCASTPKMVSLLLLCLPLCAIYWINLNKRHARASEPIERTGMIEWAPLAFSDHLCCKAPAHVCLVYGIPHRSSFSQAKHLGIVGEPRAGLTMFHQTIVTHQLAHVRGRENDPLDRYRCTVLGTSEALEAPSAQLREERSPTTRRWRWAGH